MQKREFIPENLGSIVDPMQGILFFILTTLLFNQAKYIHLVVIHCIRLLGHWRSYLKM